MTKKNLILIICAIALIVIILMVKNNVNEKASNEAEKSQEYVQVLDDGTKYNTSNKLSKEKRLGDLLISNIQLTTKDNVTVLLADVKNTGASDTKLTPVTVKILDKSRKELAAVKGLISPLQAGEITQLNVGVTADYANAYDFEIE